MNDDQRLLASAALDGAVTDEERARAETDPEVVAEVARLRRLRHDVQIVDAPDATRRETAIAAALAAFDALDRSDPPTGDAPHPPSRAARRRSRWTGPLAAAAAVAVIAVGGIVATRSGGDGDDATADLGAEQSAGAPLQDAPERELTAAPAPDDETASEDADAAADVATEATVRPPPAAGTAQELTPSVAAAPLASPAELAAFVIAPGRSGPARRATCSGGSFVGIASYLVNARAVEVEVFEVDAPHEAVARRVGDCVVVARAPLP